MISRLIPVLLSAALLCSCAAENTGKISSGAPAAGSAAVDSAVVSSATGAAFVSSAVSKLQNSSRSANVSRSSQNTKTVKSNSVSKSSSSIPSPTVKKSITSSEIQTAQKDFSDRISRLSNAKNISKVELIGETKIPYYLDSADPAVISAWTALLKKVKVSTVPYDSLDNSSGYVLVFFVDEQVVPIGGGFTDGKIYADSQRVMYTIDNYAGLKSEFQTLQKKMGFPKVQ